jgi:hypothetical protein
MPFIVQNKKDQQTRIRKDKKIYSNTFHLEGEITEKDDREEEG